MGAGPAGWSAAVSFAEVGLKTVLFAPSPDAPWPNNYGSWQDEISQWGDITHRVWPEVEIRLDATRVHVFARPYVRIDNSRLQEQLQRRGSTAGLEVRARSVVHLEHEAVGSTLELEDGERVAAKLVIDATGHQPRFAQMGRGRRPGMQVAYGVLARLEAGRIARDRMILMDFSADHLPAHDREPPTFLYAMPLEGDDVFVEETSLVARPPVDLELCKARLDVRMRAKGWQLGPTREIERCFIPMGGPMPPKHQRVVPFGAAAGAVHPATGYMLANVLKSGPRLAEAVYAIRDRQDAAYWSRAGWAALWPDDRRRAWMLYRYGMEVLVNMGVSSTAVFFDTFFKLPTKHWTGYHSGDISSGQVAQAMWALFVAAGPKLRWQLMSKGFSALMPSLMP